MTTMKRAKVKADDPAVCAFGNTGEGWDGDDHCADCHAHMTHVVEMQDGPPAPADPQTDAVPIAEAMEQAAAELGADGAVTYVDASTGAETPMPPPTDADGQTLLFPPPPAPPFDFEKAYEDLARTDIRARNKKSTWESCKRATKDAREEYDEALDALHNLFIRIDQERRNALRQVNTTAAMGVAFAAVAEQENANEGGGDMTMADTMSDETTSVEEATGTTEAPTTDAPTEDLDKTVDGEGDE